MNITEPETEKVVLYLVPHRLATTFCTHRTFLLDNAVFLLQYLQLAAKNLHAQRSLYLALRHVTVCNLIQDTEICAILLAKLLDEHRAALIYEETVAT